MLSRPWSLGTAESCTGGLLGHRLTSVSGSSQWYRGGVIAYDNRVKEKVLGLSPTLLAADGAVSEAVALAMAEGVCRLLGTDLGLSTTGIAGPRGGTQEKPLGLVYLGLVYPGGRVVERHIWPYDRQGNKEASAERIMQMVVDHLG